MPLDPILRRIESELKERLNPELPIDGKSIPGFKEWVVYQDFGQDHKGFDFASYIDDDKRCILGLPEQTEVRAISGGKVLVVHGYEDFRYSTEIAIRHGEDTWSLYAHVNPVVKVGQDVEKGQRIATLYHQKEEGQRPEQLIHLHLGITFRRNPYDPQKILFNDENLSNFERYREIATSYQTTLPKIFWHPEKIR